jgi:hypothetical protein
MASLTAFDIYFAVWELLERQFWNMPNNTCAIPLIFTKTATVCGKMTEDYEQPVK